MTQICTSYRSRPYSHTSWLHARATSSLLAKVTYASLPVFVSEVHKTASKQQRYCEHGTYVVWWGGLFNDTVSTEQLTWFRKREKLHEEHEVFKISTQNSWAWNLMGKQSLLIQLHQKNLVTLESTLIPSIQILWSVCALRHTNNGNTDHKNMFLHAVYLYHFLSQFITFAKSAAFCKNRIERSAFLLDITKLRAVIPHRRFGAIYPSYIQGSRSLFGHFDPWRWSRQQKPTCGM